MVTASSGCTALATSTARAPSSAVNAKVRTPGKSFSPWLSLCATWRSSPTRAPRHSATNVGRSVGSTSGMSLSPQAGSKLPDRLGWRHGGRGARESASRGQRHALQRAGGREWRSPRALPARLPRARLLLAPPAAGARGGRLARLGARPARLRAERPARRPRGVRDREAARRRRGALRRVGRARDLARRPRLGRRDRLAVRDAPAAPARAAHDHEPAPPRLLRARALPRLPPAAALLVRVLLPAALGAREAARRRPRRDGGPRVPRNGGEQSELPGVGARRLPPRRARARRAHRDGELLPRLRLGRRRAPPAQPRLPEDRRADAGDLGRARHRARRRDTAGHRAVRLEPHPAPPAERVALGAAGRAGRGERTARGLVALPRALTKTRRRSRAGER